MNTFDRVSRPMATTAGGRFSGIAYPTMPQCQTTTTRCPSRRTSSCCSTSSPPDAGGRTHPGVLSAEQKPLQFQQDRALLGRRFEDCFFAQPGIRPEQSALRGQLQRAHWADGFKPRDMPGIPNEMFDPADMMARAFMVWRHTGWPGRNGRIRFAHTLFNLYVVRCLALLDMRLCDAGPAAASERLAQLQEVLDALWKSSPADQPVLVRDVRWLVPVAQSPTTDDLAPYFEAARKIEECLPEADRLEIHKASVLMAGGHLRSQLRYFTMNGRSLDEKSLTLSTRGSNALDCAMTIQHLAPLLAAYEQAIARRRCGRAKQLLAGVICQGISADPELYVNRLDLLGAYSMIEPLFVTTDGERVALTPMGQRHVQLVQQYVARIERMGQHLHEDCPQFRPVSGTYSPYGVMFGFSSNILEHMTLKTLQPDAEITLQPGRRICRPRPRRAEAGLGQWMAQVAACAAGRGEAVCLPAGFRRRDLRAHRAGIARPRQHCRHIGDHRTDVPGCSGHCGSARRACAVVGPATSVAPARRNPARRRACWRIGRRGCTSSVTRRRADGWRYPRTCSPTCWATGQDVNIEGLPDSGCTDAGIDVSGTGRKTCDLNASATFVKRTYCRILSAAGRLAGP